MSEKQSNGVIIVLFVALLIVMAGISIYHKKSETINETFIKAK